MKNSITANMTFYFKGKKLELSTTVDLDSHIQQFSTIPPFYTLLAHSNNIDIYSYEYEIMEQTEVTFSQVEGMAKEFLKDDIFDTKGFLQKWHEEKMLQNIKSVAKTNMNIDDIESIPGLKQTLIEIYHLQNKKK
ncbi:MAG: hypothetical protein OEY89_08525 [Gammaproteobacteria bacterium]|nr:hypothetical protein [Gammaproteobacteria bacterium]